CVRCCCWRRVPHRLTSVTFGRDLKPISALASALQSCDQRTSCGSKFRTPSTAVPFGERCQVTQAPQEHRRHPRKEQGADLEPAKVKLTAKTRNDRERAENYADDPANPTHPEQQLSHG